MSELVLLVDCNKTPENGSKVMAVTVQFSIIFFYLMYSIGVHCFTGCNALGNIAP